MQIKILGIISAVLSAVLLSSCAAAQPAPATLDEPEVPAVEAGSDNTAMLEAYQDVLEGIHYDLTLPDGQKIDPQMGTYAEYPNQFAIFDVDGDGKDELIIRYVNTYTAGMFGAVYGFNENTGKLNLQLFEFPAMSFYQNGVVEASWSHNQGLAGRFWPCTIYTYDGETDTYVMQASVDAWDREFHETDYDGNPFPTDIDTSGDGIVFYIRPADAEGIIEPVSYSDYTDWWNTCIGNNAKVSTAELVQNIPYLPMTEQNIESIA